MNRKEFGELLQWAKRKGIRYLLGTNAPGIGLQSFLVTSTGTPDSVVLAETYYNGHVMKNMANSTYAVLVNAEAATADVSVDESSKTPLGFDIRGGGAGEIMNVVVIGTVEDMPDFS